MIFVLILWRTCDIEVIFVVILWICDCDLCDDSCKYMIVNRVVIFWDESTKSYCNLLMRYVGRRKVKKRKEKKEWKDRRRVGWGWRCKKHLYQGLLPPDTNVSSHLCRKACTDWILGTNEGYQLVQMSVFPVVCSGHTIILFYVFMDK
jgi:hypothetical protein